MSENTWATHIKGTVTRSDGTVVSFAIHPDLGWQQWGAATEALGANVEVMDAMVAGLVDAGVEPRDEDEDEDERHAGDGRRVPRQPSQH